MRWTDRRDLHRLRNVTYFAEKQRADDWAKLPRVMSVTREIPPVRLPERCSDFIHWAQIV